MLAFYVGWTTAAGCLVAAFAGFIFARRERLGSENFAARAVAYSAVSGLIPAAVYAVLDSTASDGLFWEILFLAACLGLLFVASREDQSPLALCYGQRGLRLWILILLASIGGFGWFLRRDQIDVYQLAAVFFGVLVGASEIIARYRDEPGAALLSLPGLIYLLINGSISAAALSLLRYYHASVLPALNDDQLMMSIVAGFGAMVVMRSKLFSFKTAGDEEFAVGPDAVITIFLRSVDRAIDRWRSVSRQRLVFRSTQNIAYSIRVADFFKGSLAAYQNLSNDEKSELSKVIDAVEKQPGLDPQLKLMAMAFGFLNISGEGNFSELMADLKSFLRQTQEPPTDRPSQ
jgi:hypothetical protein